MTSGSAGQAQDRAYEQYLASIGKPVAKQNNFPPDMFNMLNGGNPFGSMFGGAPSMVVLLVFLNYQEQHLLIHMKNT